MSIIYFFFQLMVNGDLGQAGEHAVKLVGKMEAEQKVEFVTIHHLNTEVINVILQIQRKLKVAIPLQEILVPKVTILIIIFFPFCNKKVYSYDINRICILTKSLILVCKRGYDKVENLCYRRIAEYSDWFNAKENRLVIYWLQYRIKK